MPQHMKKRGLFRDGNDQEHQSFKFTVICPFLKNRAVVTTQSNTMHSWLEGAGGYDQVHFIEVLNSYYSLFIY